MKKKTFLISLLLILIGASLLSSIDAELADVIAGGAAFVLVPAILLYGMNRIVAISTRSRKELAITITSVVFGGVQLLLVIGMASSLGGGMDILANQVLVGLSALGLLIAYALSFRKLHKSKAQPSR
jgi:hypothetical protein